MADICAAVHKPADITSFDVIRHLQRHFGRSQYFKPWLNAEERRLKSMPSYKKKWKGKKGAMKLKLGHGGTLDPIATGVLIVGVGSGTKKLGGFLECTKSYETVILFGAATDSYDRVGKVVSTAPYHHVTREMVEKALGQFRGSIMQTPSMFSAIKVKGKKLYEYARDGEKPPTEVMARPVEVSNLEILDWYEGGTHEFELPKEEADENVHALLQKGYSEKPLVNHLYEQKRKSPPTPDEPQTEQESTESSAKRPKTSSGDATEASSADQTAAQSQRYSPPAVKIAMNVTSGFYVRSFAHDLGLAVGSNAIMSSLVRTRQGDFDIAPENVIEYDDLNGGEEVWAPKVQRFLEKWENKEGEKE